MTLTCTCCGKKGEGVSLPALLKAGWWRGELVGADCAKYFVWCPDETPAARLDSVRAVLKARRS